MSNEVELKGPLQQDDLKEHLSCFVLGLSCWTEKILNCKQTGMALLPGVTAFDVSGSYRNS